MQILGASDSGGQAQIREAQDFFANGAAHAIRDSWAVLCDSRLGAPGCSEMLYRASPDSPVHPGTVLARLRLRLVPNSDRGAPFTSCARMSELLRVYRRCGLRESRRYWGGISGRAILAAGATPPLGSTTHALQFRGEILVHRAVRVTVTSRSHGCAQAPAQYPHAGARGYRIQPLSEPHPDGWSHQRNAPPILWNTREIERGRFRFADGGIAHAGLTAATKPCCNVTVRCNTIAVQRSQFGLWLRCAPFPVFQPFFIALGARAPRSVRPRSL